MFNQNEKFIKRACDILLVLLILVVAVGNMPKPVQAAAPNLAQFTSSGHALGFTADGIYAATGTHALRVNFVNANNVQPLADSPAGTHRVTYLDLWPGISLAYDTPQEPSCAVPTLYSQEQILEISACVTTRRSH